MSMKWKHKGREFESIGYQLKDKKTMIIYINELKIIYSFIIIKKFG